MTESQRVLTPAPPDKEIDLYELIKAIWAGKWLIVGITTAATAIAVITALMLPNIYRAEALLAPSSREGSGALSVMAAQYGGLASLAGISLGNGSADKTTLGLEILQSRKFISAYIERHDILVDLMAATGWDSGTGKLMIDIDIYDLTNEKWIRHVSPPRTTVPSSQEAYAEFMDLLSVSQDENTGLVIVSVEHYSPEVARRWVDWLIEDLNSSIVLQDVTEAEQAIEYLNRQIERTSLADLRNVFFNLIEEQTKKVMLAKVSSEYLLQTIDPAVIPEKMLRPRRSLIVFLGMIVGIFIGSAVVGVVKRREY